MTGTRQITLSKGDNAWLATFHGDDVIYGAFGTYTIPTAYRPAASAEIVRAKIQASNPHHNVTFATITRPLTDADRARLDYERDHCQHCGREYDTRYRLCPDEQCAEIYGD